MTLYQNGNTATTLPQGTYDYTATDTLDGATSNSSAPFIVHVDLTPPAIAITTGSPVTSESPIVEVTASDTFGLASEGLVKLYLDGSSSIAARLVAFLWRQPSPQIRPVRASVT